MPDHTVGTWLLLALAGVLVGMAKTGVPGLGILVVPLVFHAIPDGRLASGVLLPLLCVADVAGVAIYRRHADRGRLWHLFPWVLAGMGAGTAALSILSGGTLRVLVGVLVLLMATLHLLRQRLGSAVTGGWRAALGFGVLAGFATTVANAAGPVMSLYLLGMGMPKDQFMGTGTWFFLIINLTKVPIYAAQGMFTRDGLVTDATVLPLVALGAWCGRRVYARLPEVLFGRLVITMVVIAGVLLVVR